MYWPNWVVLDSEIRANSVGRNLIGELIFKIHGPVGCGGSEERVKKGKVFPYSLPSVGPGADPGVQAVSPQVT